MLGERLLMTGLTDGLGHVVDDCFNVMAIRIEHKSRVVFLAVVRAQPRGAIVLATMSQRGLVEASNGLAIWCGECDVGARTRSYCVGAELDCELVTAAGIAIADARVVCEHADIAKRSKRGIIERGRACEVRHGNRQVVEHGCSGLKMELSDPTA